MAPDFTYSTPDGIWTRFYPETSRGEEAYAVMAAAMPDGVVAFSPAQVPGVLAQIRGAGMTARKAKPSKPLTLDQIDAMLAELED